MVIPTIVIDKANPITHGAIVKLNFNNFSNIKAFRITLNLVILKRP